MLEAKNVRRFSAKVCLESNQFVLAVKINLEETKKDWLKTAGPFQIRKIADAYGVFEHLFGRYAYFTPRVNMDIKVRLIRFHRDNLSNHSSISYIV